MAGTMRKRGDSWQLLVYAGRDPLTGKRKQASKTVRRHDGESDRDFKKRADTELAALVTRTARRRPTTKAGTFGEHLDEWIATYPDAKGWSPKTLLETTRWVDKVIKPALGRIRLADLRATDLDRFYGELLRRGGKAKEGVKPATVRRYHAVIRSALEQAVRWERIPDNPAERATLPFVPPAKTVTPSADQVRALLAKVSADDYELLVFLRLAAVCGSRRGELCALTWGDVDLDVGSITIARALAESKDGYVVKDTKAHLAHPVAIDPVTVKMLDKVHRRARRRALAVGAKVGPASYVFARDAAAELPWRPDGVTHRFAELRDEAGLKGVRLHDLRHYVGTQMDLHGVPGATASGRLGHRSQTTTKNMYQHPVDEADRRAALLLGKQLDTDVG